MNCSISLRLFSVATIRCSVSSICLCRSCACATSSAASPPSSAVGADDAFSTVYSSSISGLKIAACSQHIITSSTTCRVSCVCRVCRNSNLDELAKHHTVYAIDLVGFGRSSRPAFTPEVRHATCVCVCCGRDARLTRVGVVGDGRTAVEPGACGGLLCGVDRRLAQAGWSRTLCAPWYLRAPPFSRAPRGFPYSSRLSPPNDWPTTRSAGHSFGGYLAGCYSLRHPEHVDTLILADPWGLPRRTAEDVAKAAKMSWRWRLAKNILQNFSPLAAIRVAGPYGTHLPTGG